MMRARALPVLMFGVVSLMLGCGSSPPPTSNSGKTATAEPTKVEAPSDEPTKPADKADDATAKREKLAADAVKILRGPDVTPPDAGSMATHEFSEAEYGLPKEHRVGLGALTDPDVDYSQYGQIVAATLRSEPTRTSLARKCGMDIEKLLVFDRKKAISTQKLMEACKVGKEALNARKPEDVHPIALMLSLGVLELLEQRGNATPSEKELARFLVQFDPAWHR